MPINITPRLVNFGNQNKNSNQTPNGENFGAGSKEKKYTDPLMKWPARGLAYSNEIGAALSELSPTLGTLLWFPAMLYFGADIYDKYKNDQTTYQPDKYRGTKQAIFQLLASVILPTGAVFAGHKITSLLGKLDKKTGLTLQAQEETMKLLGSFVKRHPLDKYADNSEAFKNDFISAMSNEIKKTKTELKLANPVSWVRHFIHRAKNEALAYEPNENLKKYAEAAVDEMISIYRQLSTDDTKIPKEFKSPKMLKKYTKMKQTLEKDPVFKDSAKTEAIDFIIRDFQKSKVMKAKVLKTIGGFITLGLAIKPIDNFVENVIMKKYVDPKLDSFEQSQINDYKKRNLQPTINRENFSETDMTA